MLTELKTPELLSNEHICKNVRYQSDKQTEDTDTDSSSRGHPRVATGSQPNPNPSPEQVSRLDNFILWVGLINSQPTEET